MKNSIIFLLVFVVSSVSAQDIFQKELYSVGTVFKYVNEIKLTEDQVKAIREIDDKHLNEFNSARWNLDAEVADLNRIISKYEVDEKASLAQMEKVLFLEEQLKKMRLSALVKVKNILTKTQQDKLKSLRTKKDEEGLNLITTINEDPRVVIKIDRSEPNKAPLYVLKDSKGKSKIVSQDSKDFLVLEPSEIKKIEVLKGEEAIRKYKENGKNGIVIIHTKTKYEYDLNSIRKVD